MMAWFASPDDRRHDPRTLGLAGALEINRHEALGLIDCLYGWAAQYEPSGDLAAHADAAIAAACDWTGDPERLVTALLEAGVLTADATIAGWYDIYGPLVKRREDQARYARSARARAHSAGVDTPSTAPSTPGRHPVDSAVDSASTRRQVDAPSPPDPHSPGAPPPGAAPTPPSGASGPSGPDTGRSTPADISGPDPARARAKPTPIQVRLGRIVDLVRDAGVEIFPSARDGTALKSCGAPADRIAEAYIAAARGEWDPGGDGWLGDSLSVHLVISRLAGYRPRREVDYRQTRDGLLPAPWREPIDDAVAF